MCRYKNCANSGSCSETRNSPYGTVRDLRLQPLIHLPNVADAPARLKRELDTVINLQTELDAIQKSLASVGDAIPQNNDNMEAIECFASLHRSHSRTVERVEKLYASLNVPAGFPELDGLPIDFVQILMMARDLKINIRKRAIGSFFEWDKLDRAAGGRDQPLGMGTIPCLGCERCTDSPGQAPSSTSRPVRPSLNVLPL